MSGRSWSRVRVRKLSGHTASTQEARENRKQDEVPRVAPLPKGPMTSPNHTTDWRSSGHVQTHETMGNIPRQTTIKRFNQSSS